MLRTIGSVTSLMFLVVACGGGGGAVGGSTSGGSSSGATSAPSGLQYGGNTVGDVGTPYGPLQPTVAGAVSGYSVGPALPAGLSLDPSTGVISGTPLTAAPKGTYTITASNEAGTATITLNVMVLVPPTALTYAGPATGTVGAPLTQLVPTLTGNADAFTVFPPLPAGLMLDPATGIVSGTPTSARLPLTYILTASNVGGAFTTSELLLTVDPPPAGAAVTGLFRSDTVMGLGYVSGAHNGLTDNSGAFTYEEGRGISFSVGAVTIGSLPTAKTLVTPVDLVSQGTSASNRVLNVVRFLMMLDQDGNANNGIQISAAVTAAAASWAPVDFDTADLPTTLGPIIQQASAADGVSHVLPDTATAQAHLSSAFYCMRSGSYYGTFGAGRLASFGRGDFTVSVFADGSMHSVAYASDTLPGFDVQTNDAVSPLLDGTFAQSAVSPSVDLQGSFADATYVSGTFVSPFTALGNFQAVGNASVTATYKLTGSYTWTPNDPTQGGPSSGSVNLVMDDSNQVAGSAIGSIAGTVSGNTFNGSVKYRLAGNLHAVPFPVSGTYSNTASGVTLDGQYSTPGSVVTFSTVGCRAN
jgi:Putative Ig domain